MTLSKLSLLALYWRIFRVTTARLPLQILAGLNVAWAVAAFIVGIVSCIPVEANVRLFPVSSTTTIRRLTSIACLQWNPDIPKKCIDYPALFLSNEAITLVFDLAVLLMPVYFISNIQRSLTQKISISITFLLGLVYVSTYSPVDDCADPQCSATLVSALRLWRLVLADRLPSADATCKSLDRRIESTN